MKTWQTDFQGVFLLKPTMHADERGFFYESYHQQRFEALLGRPVQFVQDNHSLSGQHVLRGLHFQQQHPQEKLVRVICGEIFDVLVDLRQSSPTFGEWRAFHLSQQNRHQLWIPAGLAHGFLVLGEMAEVLYKTTDYWHPEDEVTLAWDDTMLAIDWPLTAKPIISAKDQHGKSWNAVKTHHLPVISR